MRVVRGVGIDEELTKEFATKLNCLHQSLPVKYLGLPLGANPRKRRTWQPVIDKCKQKLTSWKRRFLSSAGRLTLIKYVLSYLSLFKMPEGVVKEIDKFNLDSYGEVMSLEEKFIWSAGR